MRKKIENFWVSLGFWQMHMTAWQKLTETLEADNFLAQVYDYACMPRLMTDKKPYGLKFALNHGNTAKTL